MGNRKDDDNFQTTQRKSKLDSSLIFMRETSKKNNLNRLTCEGDDMVMKTKFKTPICIAGIIALIFISPLILNNLNTQVDNSESTGSIYNVAMAETTQQNILKLCQEEDFSYELLLSIYHADGTENREFQLVEKDIAELNYLRDYWAKEGYSEEDVFELMIVSWDMGLEGCKSAIAENLNYKENEYLIEVSEYKYYLEQSINI